MALAYENGKVVRKNIPMMSNEQLLRIINQPVKRNKIYEEMEAKGLLPEPSEVQTLDEYTMEQIINANRED